jgi:hypothetical protein
MAAEEHADARHTRSAETRSQRPTPLQQRRVQKEERRTATLRLPMITLQVQIPRVRMPKINMPAMGEVVNKVKSRMPSPAEAAYFTGLGVMGLLEILEWPVVLAVGTGTVIAERVNQERRARTRQQAGK